jgi:hypothetical protein
MNDALKQNYKYWRGRNLRAGIALNNARKDLAATPPKTRYPGGPVYGWNPSGKDGHRWVESLDASGLRFVKDAHEIVSLRHTGWYSTANQDETYTGCVLQLPARNGCPLYVPAYEDPCNAGTYLVDPTSLTEGPKGGEWGGESTSLRDAAYAADSLAEHDAEEAREYSEVWQNGSWYASLGERIEIMRTEARALFAELKPIRAALSAAQVKTDATCKAIRLRIASLRESIEKANKEREELVDNIWDKDLQSAFNEGAGETVFKLA